MERGSQTETYNNEPKNCASISGIKTTAVLLFRMRDCPTDPAASVGLATFEIGVWSLQLVKVVMDEVNGGASPEEVARYARTLRNTPAYCNKGYMCYFRDPESSSRESVVA